MLVLGLILVLFAAGIAAAVIASGTDDQAVLYGGSVHVPTLVAFLVGAATLLILLIGLQITRSGVKRARQSRRNSKRLRTLEQREAERSPDGTGPAASDGDEPVAEQPGGATPRGQDDDLT
jgi:hypothetical protein